MVEQSTPETCPCPMYKTMACPCEYCRFDEFPDEEKKERAD